MARILVIEDSPENLELMTYLLEAFGHTTLAAMDGAEGIEMARREQPDLVVCDVHLPKADGYEVAHALKSDARLKGIPLVAVTALAMVGDRDKVLGAGFDGYLAKPIIPAKFIEQIDGHLHAPPSTPVLHMPEPQAAKDRLTATLWHSQHARVLVVDDSRTNRDLIRQTLEPVGYEIRAVDNVRAGLALVREAPPDLILSDLHMPEQGGFDFIRQVKADPCLAGIPFLMLSSSLWADKDRATALQLGAVRFLSRPIAARALLEEIAACLHEASGD